MSVNFRIREAAPLPPSTAVLQALARIESSARFRNSRQLSAFLSFVVQRVVSGRGGSIKGYTVAVEGLGRPANFNPDTDAVVRVEARRLRGALRQYYECEGADDPVRIAIPAGTYQPTFEWRSSSAGAQENHSSEPIHQETRERLEEHIRSQAQLVHNIQSFYGAIETLRASIATSHQVLRRCNEVLNEIE